MNIKDKMRFWDANESNIWSYQQNHPELVILDIKREIPCSFTMQEKIINVVRHSMLIRGINKWLKVRRDLIAYKKKIKKQIKEDSQRIVELKKETTRLYCHPTQVERNEKTIYDFAAYTIARNNYLVCKELLKYRNMVRSDLKALCMTNRWQLWEGKKLEDMNTIKESD